MGSHDAKYPYLSPLFGNFNGFLLLYMTVASTELPYSARVELAERGKVAGIPIDLTMGDDMLRGWPLFKNLIPEAGDSVAEIGKLCTSMPMSA